MRLISLALLSLAPAALAAQETTLFHSVRVFDGERVLASRDVLIQGGRVTRIAARIETPAGATVVDGSGKTLLPGLIDAHTHAFGQALTTALTFGVTTELEMFGDAATAAQRRAEQMAGPVTGRADAYSAGTLITVAGGHGTEYGSIPTLSSEDSAAAFVAARIAEGSDFIKLVYDDGRSYGIHWPTLSPAMLKASIDAARRQGRPSLVHIGDYESAKTAIDDGASGLAHLFVDRMPEPGFAASVAAHRAFVVPTLTVLESLTGTAGAAPLAGDPRVAPWLARQDAAMLRRTFPRQPKAPSLDYAVAESTVKQLRAAGVPILAGTDAGNPGTAHGISMHRELELLVHAGLTPTDALSAATSVPARTFGLVDRGRIAPGMRADLLLVTGDPTRDVRATRGIAGVWKAGVRFDRDAVAATIASANAALNRAPAGSESGLVSDFDDGTLATKFGAGWAVSTDAMAGGKSSATLTVVDDGAEGTPRSLAVRGTISNVFKEAWAGAMFSPGAAPFQPVNLSSKKEIRFWTRGDGGTYRVLVFAESKGFAPLARTFVAGKEWKEVALPISSFGAIDGHDIMSVLFVGGTAPGPFSFQIDRVDIR